MPNEIKQSKRSITVTFGERDSDIYEAIVTAAENDRRTASQYLLMYLVDNFNDPKSETK